ncbi:DHA1 family tetracycline resistance protein-like MFS transporter [Algoriphagus iocasae]|uniref:DHA1 family tetracycline resistance protein-like MFS transporter n=1 Tax=Algoriphagus iocasae TaxID=1836499 RepID=A0A841MU71_9BACT|nr:TCR/Tet family MFS transporter [Algoriphagus iocasae]MBB6326055.1 DHA1 family tetracycline resistance protein-like MFS transporter [Algoriphagus iocasae]
MRQNSKRSLLFIFITILVDVIGLGVIIPVVPSLIEELTGEGLSQASQYGGWLLFSFAAMQFVFSPIMGGLSDRFGRRPVLLLSLLGLGIDYVFHAFAPTLFWLFVGRLVAGIFGASFTTATAYIADISTPEKRSQNFGLIGAAFGLGFIIGPVIGGMAGAEFGPRAPFLVAAALSLLNVLYGYFVLPESLEASERRAFDWRRANPIGSLMHLRKYPVISGLVLSLVLIYISSHAVQSNWSYYTMFKFGWDEAMVGYSLGVVGLLVAIVQGGLIRVVIPKLGQAKSVYFGIALNAIGLFCFGIASLSWMMFVFLIPYCLGGISGPALQGIISSQVPSNQQGELQGALTSLVSLTSIIGPLMMNSIFAYFSSEDAPIYLPGASFYLASILMVISLIFAYRVLSTRLLKAV